MSKHLRNLAIVLGLALLGGVSGAIFPTPASASHDENECGWECGTSCHRTSGARTCEHVTEFICKTGTCGVQ